MGGIRFSVRKCDNAKMLERFLMPDYVKPLQRSFLHCRAFVRENRSPLAASAGHAFFLKML
jgi:hypothetical protein